MNILLIIDFKAFFLSPFNLGAIIGILGYCILALSISKYFNNSQILYTIPGFCTGLGVLLTFIVLFIKLNNFELASNDNQQINSLVQQLSAAFSTSIIGISASLLATLLLKWRESFSDKKLSKDKEYIQKHPNELLYDIKGAINELGGTKDQKSLEDFYILLSGISGEITAGVNKMVTRLDKKLSDYLDRIGGQVMSEANKNIRSINENFVAETSKLLKQNLLAIQELIKLNQKEAEISTEASKELRNKISEESTQFEMRFIKLLENLENSFKSSTDEMAKGYQSEAQTIRESFDNIQEMLSGMDQKIQTQTQNILESNLSKLESVFSRIKELGLHTQGQLDQSTKEFKDAVNQYHQFSDLNQSVISQVKDQIKELQELKRGMIELNAEVGEIVRNISSIQNRVADNSNIVRELDGIKRELNQLNGHTSEI